MKKLHTLLGLAFTAPLAFALLSPVAAQTSQYNFTDFDASGSGFATTVNGISNSGITVGFYTNADATFSNFSGTPGLIMALNLSGAANANGINTSGQVVGTDGNGGAFLLNSASPTAKPLTLTKADPAEASQAAFGINDSGIIAGQVTHSDGTTSGFVDTAGSFAMINPTGAAVSTSAQGINNNGLVTGFYGTAANPAMTSGFLFDTTTDTTTLLSDPVVPDLAFTQFLGINDSGEAVGYYQTNAGIQHGFLYNTGTSAYTFLDDPNVVPGGSTAMQITGIADSGEIAGFYTDAAGSQLGFIANPAAAVPEASSVVSLGLLLMLGAGGVCVAKKRKVAA